MIDPRLIREDFEAVKANCERRGSKVDPADVRALDERHRALLAEVEAARAERNRLSKERPPGPETIERVRTLKEDMARKEVELRAAKAALDEKLAWLPNMLAPDVPDGASDEDNVPIRQWGEPRRFSFEPRDHQALGELLDVIDTERAAKVAGSRFYYLKGRGASLAWAIFSWALADLTGRGFVPFFTPCVAGTHTLFGTGYLPYFADDVYKIEGTDLGLIGTSEQTLVGYHAGETLDADKLPLLYTAFSPCFRTEAGSYGKDTRGIYRVHQFHKVEQIVFCAPDDSPKYHEFCQENEERFFQALGIPYRVVKVCVGDLGAPGYKKYDLEGWSPPQNRYREMTSNTNLIDFQARRLGIRYKGRDGSRGFVHTISATAVTDRALIAILENFQEEDGSVVVPEVLRPLAGFDRITPPAG